MRRLYQDRNLQFIFGVTLMAILGVSSIIPALPSIMEGLLVSPVEIGLVISAFTLPGVLVSPVMGVLADRIGRKPILIPALFVFGIFGFACFWAQTIEQLLVLRFLQGIGASPLGVLYGILIGDLYRDDECGQAMGYNGGVLSMGTAGFPALGGALALLGWNYPFILPLLALPLGVVALLFLETPEPQASGSLKKYFRDALRQMKNKQVLCLFATTLMTFIVLYGPIITYVPILLSTQYNASSAEIGLIFFLASLFSALASFQLGRLSRLFGERPLLLCGGALYALSMLLVPKAPGLWHVVPLVICFGLAQGLNIPVVMSLLTALAPMEQRGAFMATNGFLLRLAQTIAPMLMGGLYALYDIHAVFIGGLLCSLTILFLARGAGLR